MSFLPDFTLTYCDPIGTDGYVEHEQQRASQLQSHKDHSQCKTSEDQHHSGRLCKRCQKRELLSVWQKIVPTLDDDRARIEHLVPWLDYVPGRGYIVPRVEDVIWTVGGLRTTARQCDFCCFLFQIVQRVEQTLQYFLNGEHEVRLWRAITGKKFPCELCRGSQSSPEVSFMSLRIHRAGYKSVELGTIAPYIRPTHSISRLPWHHNRKVESFVDPELLRSWLENCSQYHQKGACVPHKWQPHGAPFRLIDTTAMQVIETNDPPPYAALSYVWGKGTHRFSLNSNTFSILTSYGGLSKVSNSMPRAFKDAIRLTKMLGLKFVWVDALCVRQDNDDDMNKQMAAMSTVYSCAECTIVSDTAQVTNGIPGISKKSRNIHQNTFVGQGLSLVETRPTREHALQVSPWERRGWTLQEKYFSKRMLILSPAQAFFVCQVDSSSEAEFSGHDVLSYPLDPTRPGYIERIGQSSGLSRALSSCVPPLTIRPLLKEFLSRELSFETDTIRAFEGILSAASMGHHVHGIPFGYFHGMLLWNYNHHDPDLRTPIFPSWSWAAFKFRGRLHFAEENVPFKQVMRELQFYHCSVLDANQWQLSPTSDVEGDSTAALHALRRTVLPCDVPPSLHQHLLWFKTHSVTLHIDRLPMDVSKGTLAGQLVPRPYTEESGFYAVRSSASVPVTGPILNKAWRQAQSDYHEFIVVGHGIDAMPNEFQSFGPTDGGSVPGYQDYVFLMLIKQEKHVSFRVQLCAVGAKLKGLSQELRETWKLLA